MSQEMTISSALWKLSPAGCTLPNLLQTYRSSGFDGSITEPLFAGAGLVGLVATGAAGAAAPSSSESSKTPKKLDVCL